jgi:hypothetical protein
MTQIEKTESPEEKELKRKRVELAALENQLADVELELAALLAETQSFLGVVAASIAPKLLERNLLRAEIAAARLMQDPDDEEVKEREETAREEAEQAQQEYDTFANNRSASDSFDEAEDERQHRASDEVRNLYRKLVKLCHPDLIQDPQEKLRRTDFMKEINAAYARGDETRLEELARQWGASPDSVQGEGPGAELVRAIRQISLLQERILKAKAEIAQAMESEDSAMVGEANAEGVATYIANLEANLDAEIAELKQELLTMQADH